MNREKKKSYNGAGKLRDRWTDKKGRIYEWDSQHTEFEVYTADGKTHLGTFKPDESFIDFTKRKPGRRITK